MTAHILEFVGLGFLMYVGALVLPFANLLWVMAIKLLMGGHLYENRAAPGIYPKWSRMHLRVWCIGRLESSVLAPLGMMFRSAPLMAYVLRRLGAKVGANLQCAHDLEFSGPLDLLSVGDNIAIQTGAYIHTSKWLGQKLHIGPVSLESGCKIGMRAAIGPVVSPWAVAPGLTPLPPSYTDVGATGDVGGRPRALQRPLCQPGANLQQACQSQPAQLAFMERAQHRSCRFFSISGFSSSPRLRSHVVCGLVHTRSGDTAVASEYFKVTPLDRHYLGYEPLHLRHHLGCGSTDLYTGLSLSALHARRTRHLLLARAARRLCCCIE